MWLFAIVWWSAHDRQELHECHMIKGPEEMRHHTLGTQGEIIKGQLLD
jgi:hypothetical protein